MRPLLFLLLLASCSRLPPADDRCVQQWVSEQIDKEVCWDGNALFEEYYAHVQQRPLTVDSAVQIALLHNPEIQAYFEEIGIAEADLIEAGLFTNPVWYLAFRFPNASGFTTDLDTNVVGYLLDLLLIPLKKKVAKAQLQRVQMEVTQKILDLSYAVEEAYYDLVFQKWHAHTLASIAALKFARSQIQQAQSAVGNIFHVMEEEIMEETLFYQVEADKSQAEVIEKYRQLNALLGFEEIEWEVPKQLPDPPHERFDLAQLKEQAFTQRLDYFALWWEIEGIARTGALYKWWRYTDFVIGFAGEREPENLWIRGPAIGGAFPIFNRGQGERARIRAQLQEKMHSFEALEIAIGNDVVKAYEALAIRKQNVAAYQEGILPTRNLIVTGMEQLYNVVNLSPFDLLQVKEHYLNKVQYVEALRDYWVNRVELKRAVGGKL